MLKDRNFLFGYLLGFFLGVLVFSVRALRPPMLEGLMGYPVVLTGLVTAPRGIGTMIAMVVVGPMIKRVDARYLILAGLLLSAYTLYMMSGFSLGKIEEHTSELQSLMRISYAVFCLKHKHYMTNISIQ